MEVFLLLEFHTGLVIQVTHNVDVTAANVEYVEEQNVMWVVVVGIVED